MTAHLVARDRLFTAPLAVVNIGLRGFADELVTRGGGLACRLVAAGRGRSGGGARGLAADRARHQRRIDAVNQVALERMLAAEPVLVDVRPPTRLSRAPPGRRRSCIPARRSNGSACAARCRARSAARWCSRAGRPLSTSPRSGGKRRVHFQPNHHLRRGRADDRHDHALDAAADRREPRRSATAPTARSTKASAR